MMILWYWLDPSKNTASVRHEFVQKQVNPMGLAGIMQTMFLLLTLFKAERLMRYTTGIFDAPVSQASGDRRCPFLKAAAMGMRKFKARYAKKLQRPVASGQVVGSNSGEGHDTSSLSNKLKNFSLKSTAILHNNEHHHDDDGDSYTGSL